MQKQIKNVVQKMEGRVSTFGNQILCPFAKAGETHSVVITLVNNQVMHIKSDCDEAGFDKEALAVANAFDGECCFRAKEAVVSALKAKKRSEYFNLTGKLSERLFPALIHGVESSSMLNKQRDTGKDHLLLDQNLWIKLNGDHKYTAIAAIASNIPFNNLRVERTFDGFAVSVDGIVLAERKENEHWEIAERRLEMRAPKIKLDGYTEKFCVVCSKQYKNISQHIKADLHVDNFARQLRKIAAVIGQKGRGIRFDRLQKRAGDCGVSALISANAGLESWQYKNIFSLFSRRGYNHERGTAMDRWEWTTKVAPFL